MNKTAVQQIVERLRENIETLTKLENKIHNNDPYKGMVKIKIQTYEIAASIAAEFLEVEKKQILEAFTTGNRQDAYDGTEEVISNYYYQQTFKQ